MNRAGIVLAAAALLAGCTAHPASEPQRSGDRQALTIAVAPVRRVTFTSESELAGTVTATRSVVLGAAAAGKVVDVRVQVGDRVGAGETVALIDAAAFRASLAQANGAVTAADANRRLARAALAAAQSRATLAESTAARITQLYEQGAIAHQQQDEAQAQQAEAQAAVAQARAAIAAAEGTATEARAGVSVARVPLRDTAIVAPFAGVVVARAVEPGAVVGVGSPVVTLEDERTLEVDVALPEGVAAAVRPGNAVAVRIDALDAVLGGTVRTLLPGPDPQLRAVTAKIALPARDGVVAGMFARVRIPGASHPFMAVPIGALVSRAGQDGVFTVIDERVVFVPVQRGSVQAGMVALPGLRADIRSVAVGNLASLTDGAPVTTGP